jgi:peptide/nickel transport system ATP-binding protein
MAPLLSVEDLTVTFPDSTGAPVPVVRDVSFTVDRGEMVGLLGESGSGKSVSALSLVRLTPAPGRITGGAVRLAGTDLLTLPEAQLRRVRGGRIAFVFQEPMTAMNPVLTVGAQIIEAVRVHRPLSRRQARERARELLERVAIADAASRMDDYPHQLSGGQRQRAMIAMALAGEPELLLADEPTTALDVTIKAQILELLTRLRRELDLAVLLITHDLAVVAETCDRAVVLYAGQVVEEAAVTELFTRPAHPYTRGLLAAVPRLGRTVPPGRLPTIPGQVPDPARLPSGCPFHPRCGEAIAACPHTHPELVAAGPGHRARCLLVGGPAAGPRTPEETP